nr:hypothetical protein [Escherichia coli]
MQCSVIEHTYIIVCSIELSSYQLFHFFVYQIVSCRTLILHPELNSLPHCLHLTNRLCLLYHGNLKIRVSISGIVGSESPQGPVDISVNELTLSANFIAAICVISPPNDIPTKCALSIS